MIKHVQEDGMFQRSDGFHAAKVLHAQLVKIGASPSSSCCLMGPKKDWQLLIRHSPGGTFQVPLHMLYSGSGQNSGFGKHFWQAPSDLETKGQDEGHEGFLELLICLTRYLDQRKGPGELTKKMGYMG
jgi:hypothetical protein